MLSAEEAGCFGEFVNALTDKNGKPRRDLFPEGDAADLRNGATRIPYEVTDARRAGKTVIFIQVGDNPQHWYWDIQGRAPVMNPI